MDLCDSTQNLTNVTHEHTLPMQPTHEPKLPMQPTHESTLPMQPAHEPTLPMQPRYLADSVSFIFRLVIFT